MPEKPYQFASDTPARADAPGGAARLRALFAAALAFVTQALRPHFWFWDRHYWHLRLELGKGSELLVMIPIGGFWLAYRAYYPTEHRTWSGLLIVRHILGSRPPQQLYRDVFRREFIQRYL